eukprot:1138503-Pelagomonas_calceolata.AAC.13
MEITKRMRGAVGGLQPGEPGLVGLSSFHLYTQLGVSAGVRSLRSCAVSPSLHTRHERSSKFTNISRYQRKAGGGNSEPVGTWQETCKTLNSCFSKSKVCRLIAY